MAHTDPDALVRDYLTGDGTLDPETIRQQLSSQTDEQLADELIKTWELDSPDYDGSGVSWLDRHADRDDIIASIALFRRYERTAAIAEIRYEHAHRIDVEITHSPDGEAISGWLNGKVILDDGRSFDAGGGWVDLEGLVTPYNYRDAGQIDELAEALGLDVEDTMRLLRADCPKEWTA